MYVPTKLKGLGVPQRLRSRQGFTMVELMVVVVIGILAGIVGFASTKLIGRSVASAMASDAKSLHPALVDHFMDYNQFPTAIAPTTGTASATTMLFDPSDGDVLTIAAGSTTSQITVNVTNPTKKPGYTCSITVRTTGTSKPVCA